MKWLSQMERKFGRYAIPHLMYTLSGIMLAVYLIDLFFPGTPMQSLLALDMDLVARGQIWRFLTFLFLPPSSSPLWVLLNLYFYCLLGNALEKEWGTFRLNLFYLSGILGSVLAALVTGYGVNRYLNLSLFLAFAFLFPDHEILLFFFFPIKMKYLAYVDWILFGIQLIFGDWSTRAAIIASLINFFLFFGGDFIRFLKNEKKYGAQRRNFRREMKNNQNRYW